MMVLIQNISVQSWHQVSDKAHQITVNLSYVRLLYNLMEF